MLIVLQKLYLKLLLQVPEITKDPCQIEYNILQLSVINVNFFGFLSYGFFYIFKITTKRGCEQ